MLRKMRYFLLISAVFAVFCGLFSYVQAAENKSGVGSSDPVILPTSPLYFLKEWRRNLLRTFTRDPLSQTVLELDILDEKASELKRIEDVRPEDVTAIKHSLDNYKTTLDGLKDRLHDISSIQGDRDRDILIKQIFNRFAAHARFFDSLSKEYADNSQVLKKVNDAKDAIAGSAVKASEVIPEEKLKGLLQAFFPTSSEDNVKGETIDIIERMKTAAPEGVRKSLDDVERENFPKEFSASSTFATSSLPIISSPKQTEKACILIYDPVCGSDGKTYSNNCFAAAAGVTVQVKGECTKKLR